MTAISPRIRDWTYQAAADRLRQSATVELPDHRAHMTLDPVGNRVVTCGCGWHGNGLGWLAHIDHIVSAAVRD